MLKNISQRMWLVSGLLFLLCFALYGSSLGNPFMIDDDSLFLKNPLTQNLHRILYNFLPGGNKSLGLESSAYATDYRPLCHVLISLEYFWFGKNVVFYHLTNLALLVGICFMIYIVIRRLTEDDNVGLLTAVLFAVHPINTLMVNYVSAGYLAVEVIMMLGAIYFYSQAMTGTSRKNFYFILSLLGFVAALLCHETAATLPFYLILVAFVFFKKSGLSSIASAGPFFVVALIYAGVKVSVLESAGSFSSLTLGNYAATFTKIFTWYIAKIFTLQGIVLMWTTPLVQNRLVLWLSVFWAGMGTIVFLIYRWGLRDRKTAFLFWFLIGWLPILVGCLFRPEEGFMIEPHWLFFPSIGLFTLASLFVMKIKRAGDSGIFLSLLAVIIIVPAVVSQRYNFLWADEVRQCRYWQKQAPQNKMVNFYLANALFLRGQFAEAKMWFQRAIANERSDWQIYTNLADMAWQEGEEAQAIDYFKKSLEVNPESSVTHNNLGVCYLRKMKLDAAEEHLRKANALNPYSLEIYLNLGQVLEQKGHWEEALEFYRRAYAQQAKDERVLYALLALSLKDHGSQTTIDRAGDFLLVIQGQGFLKELGGLLARKGHIKDSIKYYLKAIALYPQDLFAYVEAGKIFANAGQFEKAAFIWKQGLKVNPNDEILQGLLKELASLSAEKKQP